MDTSRHHTWLRYLGACALGALPLTADAAETVANVAKTFGYSPTYLNGQRNFSIKNNRSTTIRIRSVGQTNWNASTCSPGSTWVRRLDYPDVGPITHSPALSPQDITIAAVPIAFEVDFGTDGIVDLTIDPDDAQIKVTLTWGPNGSQSNPLPCWADEWTGTVEQDGTSTVSDPLGAPVEPDKEFEGKILLLDNRTGQTLEIPFGDETLELQPGYNAFPFYGEVDENGFPAAAGDDWQLSTAEGPDGQGYLVGRIANGVEGGPEWVAPPSALDIEVFPPQGGMNGPTVKVPNGTNPNVKDYVTLPPGMTAGNNVPLPGGMSAGSAGLPPGVAGGSAGAVKSGTISGGLTYLPPNVSAGTVRGNNPASSAGGSTTGGNGSVVSNDDTATDYGPYVPGASLDGVGDQAKAAGKQLADDLNGQASDAIADIGSAGEGMFSGGFKFWTGTETTLGGRDTSWLNPTFNISGSLFSFSIPEGLVSFIRAVLLWFVRIKFVMACIRIVMK